MPLYTLKIPRGFPWDRIPFPTARGLWHYNRILVSMTGWLMNYEVERISEKSFPPRGTNPQFYWRNWGNPRQTLILIARFPAEIQTAHFPSKRQKQCMLFFVSERPSAYLHYLITVIFRHMCTVYVYSPVVVKHCLGLRLIYFHLINGKFIFVLCVFCWQRTFNNSLFSQKFLRTTELNV